MFCRIDMRSGVRTKRDQRDVRAGAARDCLLQLDVNLGIAGIDDAARLYRNRYVVNARACYDGRLVDWLALRMKRGISARKVTPSGVTKL